MTGFTMVMIQCPHCEEDVELEDGMSGSFDCPYCNKEFVWNGDVQTRGLKVELLQFMFGIFSPSLLFFLSLWIQITVFPPRGLDVLLYFVISTGICIIYTLVLAIYGALTKNKQLLQGAFASVVASYVIIYMYTEGL